MNRAARRIFGSEYSIDDIRTSNILQVMRNSNNRIDNRILVILEKIGYIHPFEFFNLNFDYENIEEVAIDLSRAHDLMTYLDSIYKLEEIIQNINEDQTNNMTPEEIDEEIGYNSEFYKILTETFTTFVANVKRDGELSRNFSEMSRRNRRSYKKYHNRTVAIDKVSGTNDTILDLNNYEIHKIKGILNQQQADKNKSVKFFDKTLVDIANEMGTFIYNIPKKYDKYYNSVEHDNIVVKFISSVILLIVDKDNSIYFGLYLFIMSIILYSINIISTR